MPIVYDGSESTNGGMIITFSIACPPGKYTLPHWLDIPFSNLTFPITIPLHSPSEDKNPLRNRNSVSFLPYASFPSTYKLYSLAGNGLE